MSRDIKFIFATHNQHKVDELRRVLPPGLQVISLKELNYREDIPETGATLEENALIKAKTIYGYYRQPVIAEDTGLEVEALGGEPGVFSARYAGPQADGKQNMLKLLNALEGKQTERKAHFKTVFVCIIEDKIHSFSGKIEGSIAWAPRGEGGFGYDPVFIPEGFEHTFAELGEVIKAKISHRTRAWRKLESFLHHKYTSAIQDKP